MNGKDLMIDTNIIIYFLNGDKTIAELLRGKQLYISFITELELIGFKNLLRECQIIKMSEQIKHTYKTIRKNYPLKLADSIIVSTAMNLGLHLLSADKQLLKIKGLQLLIYTP